MTNRRPRSYQETGATRPDEVAWGDTPERFRRSESTHPVIGTEPWADLSSALLRWAVKTRSGFAVDGSTAPPAVVVGGRHWVTATFGPVTVAEPVEVVAVVDTQDRVGFAYGTLLGHPVYRRRYRGSLDGPDVDPA